jgi:CBS domain containing-hemolysin-like protein
LRSAPSGSLDEIAAHGISIAIAFTFITALHIIVGELMHKALALLYPERVSAYLAAPLMGFAWLMAGPIVVLNGTANRLLRLGGIRSPRDHERLHSPEEIRMLVEQSEVGGPWQGDARLLEVFEFGRKPRSGHDPAHPDGHAGSDLTVGGRDIVADTAALAPGRSNSLDDVSGRRARQGHPVGAEEAPGRRSIMRPPLFVPGTREVEDVLADMKRLKTHLAVVLDEYGGTAGLVTMEDLLEEIVGRSWTVRRGDRPRLTRPSRQTAIRGSTPTTTNAQRHRLHNHRRLDFRPAGSACPG